MTTFESILLTKSEIIIMIVVSVIMGIIIAYTIHKYIKWKKK